MLSRARKCGKLNVYNDGECKMSYPMEGLVLSIETLHNEEVIVRIIKMGNQANAVCANQAILTKGKLIQLIHMTKLI